jgi:hypothetical protein
VGVLLEGVHRDLVAEELAGALVESEVQLDGEGGDGRGRGAEETLEGGFVADAEAVVKVFVLGMRGGGEGGIGTAEARQGAVPNSDRAGILTPVTPDLIRGPPVFGRRRWRGKGGSRIQSGMTNERRVLRPGASARLSAAQDERKQRGAD